MGDTGDMGDRQRDEPQTLHEAWARFVEATGYWRLMYWLLDRVTAGLNWLLPRVEGNPAGRWLLFGLRLLPVLMAVAAFITLAYGVLLGVMTGNGVAVIYFAAWMALLAVALVLFRKQWWT